MRARFLLVISFLVNLGIGVAYADTPCTTVEKLNTPHKLFKADNVHGGRGITLICDLYVYKKDCRPCSSKKIYDSDGKQIGKMGCYDPGNKPYGMRLYGGVPGGSYTSATKLLALARKSSTQSTNIFIDLSTSQDKSYCLKVTNPTKREGAVKPVEN